MSEKLKASTPEPIHFINTLEAKLIGKESGWYFWDETWTDRYGPYETAQDAASALHEYGESL